MADRLPRRGYPLSDAEQALVHLLAERSLDAYLLEIEKGETDNMEPNHNRVGNA